MSESVINPEIGVGIISIVITKFILPVKKEQFITKYPPWKTTQWPRQKYILKDPQSHIIT